MTSCCIPQLSFSFYRHRPIRADFSGGLITSDAGLLPLRAFDHRYGLTRGTICIALIWFLASGFIITVHAGLRGPGKYCGVIVFDRWGTCLLLSGHFVTYISDSVKEDLRPYTGKAMEIDALEVSQPQNPGDALVRKYRIIGPAPNKQQGRKSLPLRWIEVMRIRSFDPIA
jgi:hypothetical protein